MIFLKVGVRAKPYESHGYVTVHLILLYFIRMPLLTPETLFCFGDGGGWVSDIFVFKSHENKMIYTSQLGVYVNIFIFAQANYPMGLIFFRSWGPYLLKLKKPPYVERVFKDHA